MLLQNIPLKARNIVKLQTQETLVTNEQLVTSIIAFQLVITFCIGLVPSYESS